jgi:hypothetical protein
VNSNCVTITRCLLLPWVLEVQFTAVIQKGKLNIYGSCAWFVPSEPKTPQSKPMSSSFLVSGSPYKCSYSVFMRLPCRPPHFQKSKVTSNVFSPALEIHPLRVIAIVSPLSYTYSLPPFSSNFKCIEVVLSVFFFLLSKPTTRDAISN